MLKSAYLKASIRMAHETKHIYVVSKLDCYENLFIPALIENVILVKMHSFPFQ